MMPGPVLCYGDERPRFALTAESRPAVAQGRIAGSVLTFHQSIPVQVMALPLSQREWWSAPGAETSMPDHHYGSPTLPTFSAAE